MKREGVMSMETGRMMRKEGKKPVLLTSLVFV